jgi:glycosyltransferase involved in cell wall biosynthesis
MAKIRTVATIHGLDWQRQKWGKLASWYLQLGEKTAVRYADEIVVLSKNMQEYFSDKYGRETKFIPNGVSFFDCLSPKKITKQFGLEKDGYLLFIGRIVPEKGLKLLLEAFRKVKTSKKLVIVGESSDTNTYFKEVKSLAAIDDRVLLTGFLEGDILTELYCNAYMFILPSYVEGMPMALLEAMSFGNCCLTSDIPECLEVVGNCGVTFQCGQVDNLQLQIENLLLDADKVNCVRELAQNKVRQEYDWGNIVNKTLALY